MTIKHLIKYIGYIIIKPNITETIKYIGVDDTDIDLFESQYIVPNGVSYNSYIIMDEKVAVMDSVDSRKYSEWAANLEALDALADAIAAE